MVEYKNIYMKRITTLSVIATIGGICLVIIILSGEHCGECFSAPIMAAKLFACSLVIIIGSVYFKTNFLKTENIIFDIESQPLLETDEAADGVPFAGEGIIEPENDKTLNSLYTNMPCVYFHSIKEKYVKKGKSSRWEVVENFALFLPFFIKDERGKIKIDLRDMDFDFSNYKIPIQHSDFPAPKNSEIDCEPILKNSPYIEKQSGFLGLFRSTERYRISEFVLRPGVEVFAYGIARKENDTFVLHEDERCPLIISRKNRDQYVEEFYKGGNLIYLSHLLITAGYTILLLSANYFLRLNPVLILTFLLAGNGIIMGSTIFSIYNRIVTLRNRAINALSNIEVELKRRTDLIPGLVEIVKEYSRYEKEVQQIITESRAEIIFSKELPKEKKPVINSLVATIENYPNLKASGNFLDLMRTLVDTEERIAYSREFYNRSVRKYNTLISQFPFLLVSAPLGMREMDFLSIARGETVTPKVNI